MGFDHVSAEKKSDIHILTCLFVSLPHWNMSYTVPLLARVNFLKSCLRLYIL